MATLDENIAYEELEMKIIRAERCLKRMRQEVRQRWRVTEDVGCLQRIVDEMRGCDEVVGEIRNGVDSDA